jgi:hypothetical protein
MAYGNALGDRLVCFVEWACCADDVLVNGCTVEQRSGANLVLDNVPLIDQPINGASAQSDQFAGFVNTQVIFGLDFLNWSIS